MTNNVVKHPLLECVEAIILPTQFGFPTHYENFRTGELCTIQNVFIRHYPAGMMMNKNDHLAVASGALERYEDTSSVMEDGSAPLHGNHWRFKLSKKDFWNRTCEEHWTEILSGLSFDEVDVPFLDTLLGMNMKYLSKAIREYAKGPGKARWDGPVLNINRRKARDESGKLKEEYKEIGWAYINLNTYLAYKDRMDSTSENQEFEESDTQDAFYEGANFLPIGEGGYVDLDPSPWATTNSIVSSIGELKHHAETNWIMPSRSGTPWDWKPDNASLLVLIRRCEEEAKRFKETGELRTMSYTHVKSENNEGVYAKSHTIIFLHDYKEVCSMKMKDVRIITGIRENFTPHETLCRVFKLDKECSYLHFKIDIRNSEKVAVIYKEIVTEFCRLGGKWTPDRCVTAGQTLSKYLRSHRVPYALPELYRMEEGIGTKNKGEIVSKLNVKVEHKDVPDFVNNILWTPTLHAVSRLRTMYQALCETGLTPMELKGVDGVNLTKTECAERIRDAVKGIMNSVPNYSDPESSLGKLLKELHKMCNYIEKKICEILQEDEPEAPQVNEFESLPEEVKEMFVDFVKALTKRLRKTKLEEVDACSPSKMLYQFHGLD